MGSSYDISYTPSSNPDVAAAEEQLVKDLEKTGKDEMSTMSHQSDTLDYINNIDGESESAFVSMIFGLTAECDSIAGAITIVADFLTDIADVVNLVTVAENEIGLLFEQADGQKSGSTMNSTESSEMTAFIDSINFLTTSTITVSWVDEDGSQGGGTYTGILGLLSDPSAWPAGVAPMSESTESLITTSANDIKAQFTNSDGSSYWGNTSKMWNSIVTWANPEVSDSDTGIESYSDQYSKIMDDFQQIVDQADTQTQTLQYEVQQLTTMYQQYQNLTYQIMQSYAKQNMAMVQNQGK